MEFPENDFRKVRQKSGEKIEVKKIRSNSELEKNSKNIGAAPGARPAPAAPGGPREDRPRAEGPGPRELGKLLGTIAESR